jgi:DNA-binding MarR family transcriptional regulator
MDETKEVFLATFQKSIGQIMHLSMRGMREHARREGLSIPQIFALRHVYYKGTCNISEISERLGVTNPASSQLIDRLVEHGLVSRSENQQDRRYKQIILTEKGLQMLRASAQVSQHWREALADCLTPDEMEKITEALIILLEKLSQPELMEN